MTGAAAGAFVMYIKYGTLLCDCRKALEPELSLTQPSEGKPNTPPDSKPHFGMKALVVAQGEEMINIFSHVFREQGIEPRKCFAESEVLHQLSSEKFEAIVLDFDEIPKCADILKKLPRPNERVLVIALASDTGRKEAATRAGVTFLVERPIVPTQIREVLRVAYGRMLRDTQRYFRLAIALPVSIRKRSGELLQCTSLNVSQTGMAVNSPFSFIVGEPVNLAFAIPNTDVFVSAEGKVIWDDKHGKTGISFECSSPSVQSRYYEWLHDHFFMKQAESTIPATSDQVAHVH